MNINETSTPVWQELAVRDPNIRKIVISEELSDVIRGDSISPAELSSYIVGILDDDVFYVVARHPISCGKGPSDIEAEVRTVGLHPDRGITWVFQEEVTRLFAHMRKGVSTIISHNHPRTAVSNLRSMCGKEAEAMIAVLKMDMRDGIYDYLREQGVPLTLDEVVNEALSGILSEDDIAATPGLVHLLVTDTPRRLTSHLTAFKRDDEGSEFGKIPVGLLEKESWLRREWHKWVMRTYWKAFKKAGKRIEKIVEKKLSLEQQLMLRKAPRHLFYT